MKKPKLSTIAICVGLFLIFFALAFPFQNLKGKAFEYILKNTGILIVAEDLRPTLLGWPGISVKNVNISLPVAGDEMEFASEKLVFRARLAGLFPPVPGISMNMTNLKQGGDLFIKVGQPSSGIYAYIDASQVNLEQIRIPHVQEIFEGIVDAEADLHINTEELSKTAGDFEMSAEKLKTPNYMVEIPGMPFLIPGMLIGPMEIKTNIKNGIVEISTFKFGKQDSDLSGSLTGEVRLGKDYLKTFLNLTLRLAISSRILENPQNVTFLNFLSSLKTDVPGQYAMKWSASIQEMMSNPLKAVPEPAK